MKGMHLVFLAHSGFLQFQFVHARKGLALPFASHSSEIGSGLLSTFAALRVLFAHAAVTVAPIR